MEYRSLGRTGVQISPLCLGTMNFGYRTPEAKAVEIIDQALDAGINFIDTANFYGPFLDDGSGRGVTETILGQALEGKRDRVVLATKFYFPMDRNDPNARGASRRHVIQACESSLRRLRTDYIDLYQMHRPDPHVPIDETLRALDDLIRAGKVRYIGSSGFPAWRIVESLWVSKELGLNRFISEQQNYNMLLREIEREVVPMAQSHDIAILAYQPLASGVLTGKYKRGADFPADSRLADAALGGYYAQKYLSSEHAFDVLEVLGEMAVEKGCTISQLVIAWTVQQPGVTAVIIGPRTLGHFEDNLGGLEVEINEQDHQRIDSATARRG